MSRIGRQPIPVPAGVTVAIEPGSVRVNGPKGELAERIHRDIAVVQDGEQLLVSRPTDRGEHRALHGLTRSLVANMVQGVTAGYEKRLEIQGVGYRAQLKGKNLELAVGYSHPVPIPAPAGIEFEVPQPTRIVVKGISKQLVGETAAIIRKQRPPGALQGQGHPLRGRVRPAQGGQARMSVITKEKRRLKRRRRVRAKIAGSATRPRISVFRSNQGLSAQLIDDSSRAHARRCQLVRARATLAGQARAHQASRRSARRARQGGRHLRGRVRSRRIPFPRPRARLCRGDSRDGHHRLARREPR